MFTSIYCSFTLTALAGVLCMVPQVAFLVDLCPVPLPDCSGDPTPKYVKDPKDCTRFFECRVVPLGTTDDPTPVGPIPCPSGFFNQGMAADGAYPPCLEDNYCEEECLCDQKCVEDGQVYADLQDCGRFYSCVCPTIDPTDCFSMPETCEFSPTGPYFDGAVCQENRYFCCA